MIWKCKETEKLSVILTKEILYRKGGNTTRVLAVDVAHCAKCLLAPWLQFLYLIIQVDLWQRAHTPQIQISEPLWHCGGHSTLQAREIATSKGWLFVCPFWLCIFATCLLIGCCVFVWQLSGMCVCECVCMRIGCNRSTQRDPPPLVWRENATRLASPARAYYPEAVRAPGCQLRLALLWVSLCFTYNNRDACRRFTENYYLFFFMSNWKTL